MSQYVNRFKNQPIYVYGLFLLIGLIQGIGRILRLQFGAAELNPNFINVWMPLSETVRRGTGLYLDGAADNKPPLFQLLNLALSFTGEHIAVFLVLIGLVNGLTAALLYRYLNIHHSRAAGLLGGLLYLLSLLLVGGNEINVRSFAALGLMAALVLRPEILRGAAVGAAGLFSQYAIFAIPVFVWDVHRSR